MAALFMMYGPAKKLSRVNANLQQAIAAAGRIFEMLDTHTEVEDKGTRVMAPVRERIEFRASRSTTTIATSARSSRTCRSPSAPAR